MKYQEIEGDLIKLAQEGKFDVIAHGCNCFCRMGAGIAPQMAKAFGCDTFPAEGSEYKGDIQKMGCIDDQRVTLKVELSPDKAFLQVVNCYTQYGYGNPKGDLDYEALTLCIRKIAAIYHGKHIGLPQIGAGLAKGNWDRIKAIIQKELAAYCEVTIVIFKPS